MKKLLALLFLLFAVPAQANVPCSLPFTLTNGTTADATQVMANYNAIITCLTNAAIAGANNDITSLNALTSSLSPAFGGTNVFLGGTSSGASNAQIVTSTTPNTFALTTGYSVIFKAGVTNTGATTLQVGSAPATNVFRATPTGAQALTGGEIQSGNLVWAVYDGVEFQLIASSAQFGGFGPLTAIASAGTTDLGTVPSHNVQVTGGATVTSFGSSASVTYPIYQLQFTGTVTLTNSGGLSLLGGANIVTASGDTSTVMYTGSGNWTMLDFNRFAAAPNLGKPPTFQIFLSGSGTYTPPTSPAPLYIIVEMAGGGGGGGAGTTGSGGSGVLSSFGSWVTNPGTGAAPGGGAGGIGGSGGANGTGTLIERLQGGSGSTGGLTVTVGTNPGSGLGGSNPFGGAGRGGSGTAGDNGAANTGAGGGGGGSSSGTGSGSGGGSGEYVKFMVSPPASAAYSVGTGGTFGTGSGANGGAGAAGRINVYEYYN